MIQTIVKKKAPLLLSKKFPANNPEAGEPTHFREKIESGRKIHTIRANYDWWSEKSKKINSGEMTLNLRSWTGKPYDSKQEEWGVFDKVGIQKIHIEYNPFENICCDLLIDGKKVSEEIVANNDGLTLRQFTDWFFNPEKKIYEFEGVVIHFTDFRY